VRAIHSVVRLSFILFIPLAMGAATEQTLWEPPPVARLQAPTDSAGARNAEKNIQSLTLGATVIVLEKTSLQQIQQKLGGSIGGNGDAGNSRRWLCYYQPHAPAPWIVWLESSALHSHTIVGFQWEKIPAAATPDSRCRELPSASQVVLPGSVQLGQGRDEVLAALGEPTVERGDALLFVRVHPVTVRNNPFTTSNTVKVAMADGHVDAVAAWSATTD
jgi:hypothetical protein